MMNRGNGKLRKARAALLLPTVVAQPKEDCQPRQRVLVPFLYEAMFLYMISLFWNHHVIQESPRD